MSRVKAPTLQREYLDVIEATGGMYSEGAYVVPLHYQDARSDKFYFVIFEAGSRANTFTVLAGYGRVGHKAQTAVIVENVDHNTASAEFWRTVAAKYRKGYRPAKAAVMRAVAMKAAEEL